MGLFLFPKKPLSIQTERCLITEKPMQPFSQAQKASMLSIQAGLALKRLVSFMFLDIFLFLKEIRLGQSLLGYPAYGMTMTIFHR